MIKRLLALAALCLGLSASVPAFAAPDPAIRMDVGVCDPWNPTNCLAPSASGGLPTTNTPGTATSTRVSPTTVTTGGTYQTAFAASTTRKGCLLQNPSTATEILSVRVGGTIVYTIPIGAVFNCASPSGVVISDLIEVTAATTSHAFDGARQ